MVQALPGCDLERFERVRCRMEGEAFRRLLQEPGAADNGFGRVVELLTEGESGYAGLEVVAGVAPRFACTCSMEKMAAVMRSIPIPERMSMVKQGEDVSIRCHFCSKKYTLTIADCIAAWNDRPDA
jgi:molecular chaperone Hsp33